MNAHDRVMAALNHRPPDRVPRFDSFWEEFASHCIDELKLSKQTDLDDYFQIDVAVAVADETPFPSKCRVVEETGGMRTEWDGWGRLLQTQPGTAFYRELEVAIPEKQDLDRIRFEPPRLDRRYTGFLETVAVLRAKRCVFCKTGGPYLRSAFLRGELNFLTDMASDPEFATALATRVADHLIQIGLESLRRGHLYESGLWIFDDIASNRGPLMSPSTFERIFLPSYRRMIRAFKQAGATKVIFHSDGDIRPMIEMLMDAGIDGINPVEPRAGMDVPTLKSKYGSRLAYIGGMCNSVVLPTGSAEEIRRRARAILEVGRSGGVIIGAHSIGPDIPVANYLCYHQTVVSEGMS